MLRIVLICVLLHLPSFSWCWGFWAHARINRYACFTLPTPLFAFYKKNIDWLADHSADPDKRRYSDPEEAPRHFIDVDGYGVLEAIPIHYSDACCMYGEDSVKAHGTVPWTVTDFYRKLVRAFVECDADRILYYSACLGHYIGDAHVPLHCTSNYNGQKTGQHGIHGFWETRLPELFGESYEIVTARAFYLENPQLRIWCTIRESADAVDSVLRIESELDRSTRSDRKYAFDDRGARVVRTYSAEYSDRYHYRLDGQVERRMASAVHTVGSFWYTAWIDAGQPELEGMRISTFWQEEIRDTTGPVVQPLRDCH